MAYKIITCRCGKEIHKLKKKCHIRPMECCDCNDSYVGCYSNPLCRKDFHCELEWRLEHLLDNLDDTERLADMAKAWGFTIERIKKEWRAIPFISLSEKHKELKEAE